MRRIIIPNPDHPPYTLAIGARRGRVRAAMTPMPRHDLSPMRYLQVLPGEELPDVSALAPFKALLVVDVPVPEAKVQSICTWLVEMGCRYVVCRASAPENWCDAIRSANLRCRDIESMPASEFVMATPHRDETVKQVIWYIKKYAHHPDVSCDECLVVHLSETSQEALFVSLYHRA